MTMNLICRVCGFDHESNPPTLSHLAISIWRLSLTVVSVRSTKGLNTPRLMLVVDFRKYSFIYKSIISSWISIGASAVVRKPHRSSWLDLAATSWMPVRCYGLDNKLY
jgi:hypothetical protein